MAQTNIAIYLSITNWLIIMFILYYSIMKLSFLPILKSKLFVKTSIVLPSYSLSFKLILSSPNGLKYPIFIL